MYASMPFSDLSNDFAKVMSKHYPCKRDTDMIQVSNLDPKSSEINKLKSDLEQTQTTIALLGNTLAGELKLLCNTWSRPCSLQNRPAN